MNYHNITKDDMLNGSGLRVVLWLSGCNHYCKGCQNPQTWDCNDGIKFDISAKNEIFEQLNTNHISGITFSGGDPLHKNNVEEVYNLCNEIRRKYPNKTIWLYTGSTWEEIICKAGIICSSNISEDDYIWKKRKEILELTDVIVDGEYKEELKDVNYPWAGSTNQRVIDTKKSLLKGEVELWKQEVLVKTNTN